MVKRLKLKLGLELAFKDFPQDESCSVGVWIKRGARSEPIRIKGVAHFLEHLLFKGTKKYSHKDITRDIEGRGGQLNGFTSQEVTCYFAKVLRKNLSKALDVLSDMVAFPLLKQEDINRERGVVLEEIKMYRDMPSSRVSSILDSLLWGSHPLGIDVIGLEDTVSKITAIDMRSFQMASYRPSNIAIVICGRDMGFEIYEEAVKKFSLQRYGKRMPLPKFSSPKVYPGFKFSQEITSFEQTHISLGFKGLKVSDKDRFILDLINIILGGNMSSRLFESIREKLGLAYEISTSVKKFADTGAFIVHCGLEARNLLLALEVIAKELVRMKNFNVGRKELSRAKDYCLGGLAMSFENNLNTMSYIGESLCKTGRVLTFKELERRISSVTVSEIKSLAEKVFCLDKAKVALVTNENRDFKPESEKIIRKYA